MSSLSPVEFSIAAAASSISSEFSLNSNVSTMMNTHHALPILQQFQSQPANIGGFLSPVIIFFGEEFAGAPPIHHRKDPIFLLPLFLSPSSSSAINDELRVQQLRPPTASNEPGMLMSLKLLKKTDKQPYKPNNHPI
ncbi:hypothetical protein H5410_027463 [Solanum commersonii]|uniref:Uncharacterized protein n=1 Tax=Solanum commersonii TaxID=4109 RepID=A0A9J5YZ82_SOLCO|nr:hypothetical protein H5410_027463 [Solanum commersonii]